MQKFIKGTFVLLFLPSIGLATNCAPNDTECKTLQKQLSAMQEMGIKPTQVIQPTSGEEKKEPEKAAPRPFTIPFPPFAKQPQKKSDGETEQQNNSITPQAGMQLNNNQQTDSTAGSSAPQPVTIQYR